LEVIHLFQDLPENHFGVWSHLHTDCCCCYYFYYGAANNSRSLDNGRPKFDHATKSQL